METNNLKISQEQIDYIKFYMSWYDITEKQLEAVILLCNMSFTEGTSSGMLSMFRDTQKNIKEVFKTDREAVDAIF